MFLPTSPLPGKYRHCFKKIAAIFEDTADVSDDTAAISEIAALLRKNRCYPKNLADVARVPAVSNLS